MNSIRPSEVDFPHFLELLDMKYIKIVSTLQASELGIVTTKYTCVIVTRFSPLSDKGNDRMEAFIPPVD
jgi:hypothetical protein